MPSFLDTNIVKFSSRTKKHNSVSRRTDNYILTWSNTQYYFGQRTPLKILPLLRYNAGFNWIGSLQPVTLVRHAVRTSSTCFLNHPRYIVLILSWPPMLRVSFRTHSFVDRTHWLVTVTATTSFFPNSSCLHSLQHFYVTQTLH